MSGKGWEIVSPSHSRFHHTSKHGSLGGSVEKANIVQRRRFVVGLSAALRGEEGEGGSRRSRRRRSLARELVEEEEEERGRKRRSKNEDREEWRLETHREQERAARAKRSRQRKSAKKSAYYAKYGEEEQKRINARLSKGSSSPSPASASISSSIIRALQLSVLPDSVPCRSSQAQRVSQQIVRSIRADQAGSLYISGQPGTGKTVTVHRVVQQLQEQRDAGELPAFDFIEANAMELGEPKKLFSFMLAALTGETLPPDKAARALTKRFFSGKTRSPVYIVMLVDELDSLMDRSKTVIHTLFEWASRTDTARLFVVGVANTMNLSEHLSSKTASRFGVAKQVFPPYTQDDIVTIIEARLGEHASVFAPGALKLVAAKTANVTGDIRRALQACSNAAEALEECDEKSVSISMMSKVLKEMRESPLGTVVRGASEYARVFLVALAMEMAATGTCETTLGAVLYRLSSALAYMEMRDPGMQAWERVCASLVSQGVLLAPPAWKARSERTLKVTGNPEDILFHLKEDALLNKYPQGTQ